MMSTARRSSHRQVPSSPAPWQGGKTGAAFSRYNGFFQERAGISWIVWLFYAVVISSFMGSAFGFRTGSILWFPLRVATLACIPLFFIRHYSKISRFSRFVSWFLVSMVIYGFVSLVWSPDPVLGFRKAAILFTGVLLATIVICCARDRETLGRIMLIWSVATIGTSILGFYEVHSGQYFFNFEMENIEAIARVRNQIGWLIPRVFSTNWNNYAFSNGLSAFVLLGWSLEAIGVRRVLAVVGSVCAFTLVFLSYSRAATLGVGIGMAIFGICVVIARTTAIHIKAIVVVSVIIGSFGWFSRSAIVLDSDVGIALLSKWQAADDSTRVYYYSQAISAAADSLGFGMGLGASTEIIGGGSYHSYGMEVLAELGVWVFLALCFIFIRIGAKLWRAVRTQRNVYWNSALLASCVAFSFLQLGPSGIMGEGVYWLWLGILVAYVEQISLSPPPSVVKR